MKHYTPKMNVWFSSTSYHPLHPGEVQPFVPGVRVSVQGSFVLGVGVEANKKVASCS